MAAPEVPLEQSQEDIVHHAHEATESWIMGVALTAAMLAALAAVTALLAEHHANEALISQIQAANKWIQASDKWNEYQADSTKEKVIQTKLLLLEAFGKKPAADDPDTAEKVAKYQREKPKIKAEAEAMEEESKEREAESAQHVQRHGPLSRGVTMFQLAIAVGAISVLTKRKVFWAVAVGFGAVGAGFLFMGLV